MKLGKKLKREVCRLLEDYGNSRKLETQKLVDMKSEILYWVTSLPDHLRLKDVPSVTDPLLSTQPKSSSLSRKLPGDGNITEDDSLYLFAMRCDLAISARHVLVSLYLPFIKNTGPQEGKAEEEEDLYGPSAEMAYVSQLLVDPALYIVQVWKYSHAMFRHFRPSMFMYYSFTKELFDATVVLGHIAIVQPIYATKALDGLYAVIKVINDTSVPTECRSAIDNGIMPSEAVDIIRNLFWNVEAKRGKTTRSLLTKRKHE